MSLMRDIVANGEVTLEYIPTNSMVTNFMTKLIAKGSFVA